MSTITLKTMTGTTQTVALAQAAAAGEWTLNKEAHATRVVYFEAGNENAIPAAGLAARAGTELFAMPKVVTDCRQMVHELEPEFLDWLADYVPMQLLEERVIKRIAFSDLINCRIEDPDPIPERALRKLLDDGHFHAIGSFVDMDFLARELCVFDELDFHDLPRKFLSNLWCRSADARSLSCASCSSLYSCAVCAQQKQAQSVRIMQLLVLVRGSLFRIAMEYYHWEADSEVDDY